VKEKNMKKISIAAAALLMPLVLQSALAASRHEERTAYCHKRTAGMNHDERDDFLRHCLRKKSGLSDAQKRKQDRKQYCNGQVAGVKGSERHAALNSCLKNH
jgi:hypothetical protein